MPNNLIQVYRTKFNRFKEIQGNQEDNKAKTHNVHQPGKKHQACKGTGKHDAGPGGVNQ